MLLFCTEWRELRTPLAESGEHSLQVQSVNGSIAMVIHSCIDDGLAELRYNRLQIEDIHLAGLRIVTISHITLEVRTTQGKHDRVRAQGALD